MQKSTLYLIIVLIVSLTILGVAGEYFIYEYYAVRQQPQQTSQTPINTQANTNTTQTNSGSSENSMTSFSFTSPLAVGNINETNHTVTAIVPPDTDVTKLVPTIEISQYATISPALGTPQDFTNPVNYTVTAQNGSVQKYTITVNVASITKNVQRLITSFVISGFNPEVDGYIDNDTYSITAVVPDGTDLTKLTPTIKVSDGATVFPESGTVQDFTNPVTYTVTDIYGSTQNYTVTVVTESNSG